MTLRLGLGISFLLNIAGLAAASSGDVEPWTPAGISGPQFESHPAFDPHNGDLYFVRSYFGSSRPGGLGKNEVWRAQQNSSGAWRGGISVQR
jgi:hypothetical protein